MIDGVLLLWYILTLLSLIFVIWDQFTNTPSMRVMTLAWVLIIIYTGPLGLFVYLLSCRQPLPNTHDQFINVHWKQSIGSLIHCVAGDATAIIIMAAILHYFDLPNGIELIVEYCAAWAFGLFIFQALFMRAMFKSYWQAVSNTLFAETVSMNMVMTGMFPVMIAIKSWFPISSDPFTAYFWGRMSIATIIGFIIAYPINSWMVARNIKHGMMSKTQPSTHTGHAHHQHTEHKMQMQPPNLFQQILITIATFAIFIGTLWLTSYIIPITFS